MYDSVMVPCPKCGTRVEAQSKAGDCSLATYELDNAPPKVLADVATDGPYYCENRECGCVFEVAISVVTRVEARTVPE